MFVLITGISVIDTFKNLINSFYREEEYEEPEQEHRPVKKNKKKSANNQVRLENLKVYESDEKHKGKAKDFFENEDEIHEINVPDDDFLTFNNDVEKIVLHDEREEQIPVSFSKKTSVTKSRRKSEPASVETAAGVSSAVPMGDTQEIPVQQTKDIFDAEFDDVEDVLSCAINGNEHPEVVSVIPDDYDPEIYTLLPLYSSSVRACLPPVQASSPSESSLPFLSHWKMQNPYPDHNHPVSH